MVTRHRELTLLTIRRKYFKHLEYDALRQLRYYNNCEI